MSGFLHTDRRILEEIFRPARRICDRSRELIERFQLLPKDSKKAFPMKMPTLRTNFSHQRKRIAKDFDNPRLQKLTFTSVRHWKAITEYHKTKDIIHVKQLLGHKNLSSTMIYIDIEKALYGNHENEEFISRVATSLKGARALLEAGFEYVTDMDGYKLFRKRRSSLEYMPSSKSMSKTF